MPILEPIKRIELIRYLKQLGFEGPFSGSKHQYMRKDDISVRLPNPHGSDIGNPHSALQNVLSAFSRKILNNGQEVKY